MSEQEEFEKWWIRFVVDNLHHQCTSDERLIAEHSWKACAKRNSEILDNQAKEFSIAINNEYEKIIKKEAIIEQQAAEIAALRGFAKSMREYQDNVIRAAVIRECMAFKLIDENGNPTKFLTGKESE